MTVRFELTIGWLSIVFDPQPQLEEDEPADEPSKGSGWPLDSQAEYGADTRHAELHGDPDRNWSYDPGDKPRLGFRNNPPNR